MTMYLGNKEKYSADIWAVIEQYLPNIDENTWYVEPFCGMCGLTTHVPLKNKILNDYSTPLMAYLKKIQVSVDWLPKTSSEFPINRDIYNFYRRQMEQGIINPVLAGYIGYCFSHNGMYFQGYLGDKQSNLVERAYTSALRIHEVIQGAKLFNVSYKDLVIPENSIIVCDGPYMNTTQYKAIKEKFIHSEYFEWCRYQKDRGCHVFVCEYEIEEPRFELIYEFKRTDLIGSGGKAKKGKKHVNTYQLEEYI